MKTGVFQADLNQTSHLFPLLSIQCMSRRDLSVKGGTSERCYHTRSGRTDEQRYAIISPYFDGRRKMNGPYPEITNISFLVKLFFKLSSVLIRRGCLYAWQTDGHNSGVFRRWMEICEWKHEYKVHVWCSALSTKVRDLCFLLNGSSIIKLVW